MKTLMDARYTAEELNDVERDVYEAISENNDIPVDDNGFEIGTFRVQITWKPEE